MTKRWKTGRQKGRKKRDKDMKDRKAGRQKDRKTEKWKDRMTERQTCTKVYQKSKWPAFYKDQKDGKYFWWLRVRRLNFMRSKFVFSWDRIHEIEFFGTFHEIEIPNNWFDLLQSHDQKFDLLKKLNFDLMKFDLMIIFLVISWIF